MTERRFRNDTWVTDTLGYFDGLSGIVRDASRQAIERGGLEIAFWLYTVELPAGNIKHVAEQWLVEAESPVSRGIGA